MRFELQKILLVDDDPDDCFLFRKALSDIDACLQLIFVSDCEDLVPVLLARQPQMVFMDINMPKMSGFDCIEQIRQLEVYKHLPVVMYSCSEQIPFIKKAYEFGAHLYLRKPVSYEGLVDSLRQIIGMDWNHPEVIAGSYCSGGTYNVFEAA